MNSETSPAMQRAIDLLKAGKTVEAEEEMQAAAQLAEKEFGTYHPQTASTYNELGTVLWNLDNYKGAVKAYRRACEGPLPKEELEKRIILALANS